MALTKLRKMRSLVIMIDTPSRALALLGGAKAVADSIKRPVTTVASWAARESIPVDVWPELVALAAQNKVAGITYEAMTLAHAGQATAEVGRRAPRRKAKAAA